MGFCDFWTRSDDDEGHDDDHHDDGDHDLHGGCHFLVIMMVLCHFYDDVIIFVTFFAILILVAGREVFSRGLVNGVSRWKVLL